MESFGRCLAVILAVLLLILAPVKILIQAQTITEDGWYESRARELVALADRQGYLTRAQYEQFAYEVSNKGASWEIELTHARMKTGLVRSDSRQTIMLLSEKGADHVHTSDCYTHTHSDKTDDKRGRYYCTHTHTAECKNDGWTVINFVTCPRCSLTCELYLYTYNKYGSLEYSTPLYIPSGGRCPICNGSLSGIKYRFISYYTCGFSAEQESSSNRLPASIKNPVTGAVQSDFFSTPLDGYSYGCYRYSVHNHEAEHCANYLSQKVLPVLCNTCGSTVGAVIWSYNRDGSIRDIYRPSEVYSCCGTGSRAREDKAVKEYTYLCGKSSGWEFSCEKELEASIPACDRVILSVAPVRAEQTVYAGDRIDTSLEAVYLNGSKSTVQGESTFRSDKPGSYRALITLTGYIGTAKTAGKAEASIAVTVLPKEKTCKNGHVYRLNADGTDPGCPVCKTTVSGLSVILGTETIYKGDSIPVKKLTAEYLDGHIQEIREGYEVFYDKEKTGNITVEFRYGGTFCRMPVTVKPNVTGLKTEPVRQNIVKYNKAGYLVTALYEDGTTKYVEDYKISGIDVRRVGVQNGVISYSENGRKVESSVSVTVLPLSATCANGHTYDRDADDISWGCPVCRETITALEVCPAVYYGRVGDALPITVIALYQDGHTEEVKDYECSYRADQIGEQEIEIRYNGLKAALKAILKQLKFCPVCGGELEQDTTCPNCSNTVVELLIAPEKQSIEYGGYPEFQVAAVYGDGRREPADGYMTDFREGEAGIQDVTIYYKGLMAHALVEVGRTPEDAPAGSLIGITAEFIGGAVVQKGASLKIRICASYTDGRREIFYSGYTVKNFDPMKTGIQEIEVWYQEKSVGLTVEVTEVLNRVYCENGHYYLLNPDGSDPGCPVCSGGLQEETADFLDIRYSPQILPVLEENGIYEMEEGDYFAVRLTRKTQSFAEKLLVLFGIQESGKKEIVYSGLVTGREETDEGI